MLDINWGDVMNILNLCKPYLIALAVVLVLAIITLIIVKKAERTKRKLIRSEAGIAVILTIIICANAILLGPLSNIVSLAMGNGTLSDESIEVAEKAALEIAEEGVVLLENKDGSLPLKTTNLNVFGWASTNPCYGGTGSGALNDNYEKVTLLQGLENSGFSLNSDLSEFYIEYRAEHPEISPFIQDWTLPEPPAETYPEELINDAKGFSDTALIVLSRTGAEHNDLPINVNTAADLWQNSDTFKADFQNNSDDYEDFPEGTTYLDLSQSEKDMVDLVCSNFENVVVILNGSNAMNLSFIREYKQIKGALWCAGPGQNGFNALGTVLNGETNPSGKTSDTFVTDFYQTPYIHNAGSFTYENMTEFTGDSWGYPTSPTFVNYVEGIYVGYKYYETAAEEGAIDYDALVQYPFGHGLSYTEFEQTMSELESNADGTITVTVEVTNTGNTAGKDVVELYYTPPYVNGGIEKASVNLIDFAKTKQLEPGESETISISFHEEDLASFDEKNADCYVLDKGTYSISIREDSHTILDSKEYEIPETVTYKEDNARTSDKNAAVTQLGDVQGDVEYLSRADHFSNLESAIAAPADYNMSEKYKEAFLNNSNYDPEDYNNPEDEMPVTGADNGLSLIDLRGVDYDDSKWESLLDQLTVSDMNEMIAIGGFGSAVAESVGKVSTTDCDGPASINNNFTGVGSIGFPSATMIACTWNKDKALEFGQNIGAMAEEMNVSGWYAPATNTHRTPFGGRNFEYYSEDGVLAGHMAANAEKGAWEYGVYGCVKHFALNDQEINRQAMICTWTTEQAAREIYLKPFEIAVKDGGANAIMSSYNYIGTTYAGANDALLNKILRDEWGFQGFVVSDYFGNFGFMDADQQVRNGCDRCLANYDVGTNYVEDTTSATSVKAMRQACKNMLFTTVNSRAYEGDNADPAMESWKIILIVLDVLFAAGLIVLETLAIRKYNKRKNASEIKIESVSKE